MLRSGNARLLDVGRHTISGLVPEPEDDKSVQSHPEVVAKLAAAAGLSLLDAKRYKAAAKKFTEVWWHTTQFPASLLSCDCPSMIISPSVVFS